MKEEAYRAGVGIAVQGITGALEEGEGEEEEQAQEEESTQSEEEGEEPKERRSCVEIGECDWREGQRRKHGGLVAGQRRSLLIAR